MRPLIDAFRRHPELAVFLALALGHSLGRVRLRGFSLGPILGTLLAGVAVGQWDVPVSATLKNAFFLLWLFAIGYGTGPLFFRGLRATGVPQVALTLLLCGTASATALAASALLGFDAGSSGGLLAGAMTSSAALGAVTDALGKLELGPEPARILAARSAVAFAVSYLLGTALVIALLSRVGPRLLGGDLAAACRALEDEMGMVRRDPSVGSAYAAVVARAFAIPPAFDGRTVAELEAAFAGERVFVERVRPAGGRGDGRGPALRDAPPGALRLGEGDRVALSGRREVLVGDANPLRAHEVDDRALLDLPSVAVDLLMTRKELAGHTLAELAEELGARGVFAERLTRAGLELPFTPATRVERGDVLRLVGTQGNVGRVAALAGHAEWPTEESDLASVAAAIVIGGLVGLPTLRLGHLEIGLGLFVGVLLAGLVFGWLRSVQPRFGHLPPAALRLMDSLGLTGFLAAVGMEAGPDFFRGLAQAGSSLVPATVAVVSLPHLLTILVGRRVFRMHPGILLGVCCGAGTSAPALAAVQEVADSKVPALGYGVACALGNVVLAIAAGALVIGVAG